MHVEVQRTSYASRFSVSIMWVLGNPIGRFPIGGNELGALGSEVSYLENLVFCLYSFIYYSCVLLIESCLINIQKYTVLILDI